MTVKYPELIQRGSNEPPEFIAAHRAGKFYLYDDLPKIVVAAIAKRVLPVRSIIREGYVEIHAWSPDFKAGVLPGQELPHYRWSYDVNEDGSPLDPVVLHCVCEGEAGQEAGKEDDHGLRQEDAPRLPS